MTTSHVFFRPIIFSQCVTGIVTPPGSASSAHVSGCARPLSSDRAQRIRIHSVSSGNKNRVTVHTGAASVSPCDEKKSVMLCRISKSQPPI